MRRMLTACAVGTLSVAAAGWLAVFALGIKVPSVLASAPAEVWQSAIAIVAPAGPASARPAVPAKATVVAQGVLARTLAHDGGANLYLTTPTSPNRVFSLPTPPNAPSETIDGSGAANDDIAASFAAANALARMVPFAGSAQKGSLGDSGTALLAQFDLKTDSIVMRSGIAIASDGTTFIADTLNGTIRRISSPNSSEPGVVRSIAGRWATGESSLLIEPVGIALDRAGNLYIADHAAGAVYLVRAATSAAPGASEILAHVVAPGSIAAAPDGSRVFVASPDTGKLFAIATKTRAINAISGFELPAKTRASLSSARTGANIIGSSSASGSYCGFTAETAPETCPAGLAVDGGGNLFIADASLGQIFRVDAKTGASKLAASGLTAPGDMSFDAAGNLFIADQGSERIFEFIGMGQPLSALSITPPAPLPPPTAPEVCTALAIQPNAYSFCNKPVDGVTSTQPFTLTNNSASTVNSLAWSISPVLTPSNFAIQGTTCTATLASGASCILNVAFTPQQSGEVDSAVTATDLAGDTTSSEVGGTGTDYQLALAANQTALLSVQQGDGVTFNLQLIPDGVFSENVTFVCPPPATINQQLNGFVPPYTSCTITPPSAVVLPNTPVPFTITFQTTYNFLPPTAASLPVGRIGAPRLSGGTPPLAVSPMLGFPALAMIVLLAIFWGAERKKMQHAGISFGLRSGLATLALTTALVGIGFLGACKKYYANPAIQTTPVGVTTMTVAATSQGVSRGVPITLDVVKKVPVLPGVVSGGGR